LVKNIQLNNMSKRIIPVKIGISDHVGKAIISDEGGGATILDEKKGSEIELTTLDKFIKDNSITSVGVLKIDVEGSEKEIILGASKETLSICKYITVEFDIRTGKYLGAMVEKLSETHHIRTMGSWERGGMIFAWLY
jgi:FkbM family methyltransferase